MIRIDAAWFAVEPLDMRAGVDTALGRVVNVFGEARAHHAYLFVNKRANRMKVLMHDGFGLWLCARRPVASKSCCHTAGNGGGNSLERAEDVMWRNNSLLARTRQTWKLRTAITSWLLAPVLMVAPWALGLSSESLSHGALLLATLAAANGFVLSFIIKCPRCRTRWFWRAMQSRAPGDWHEALKSQSICPTCSYPAADKRSR